MALAHEMCGVWGFALLFGGFSVSFAIYLFFFNHHANTLQLLALSSGTTTRAEESFFSFVFSHILFPALPYPRQQNGIVHSCNFEGVSCAV